MANKQKNKTKEYWNIRTLKQKNKTKDSQIWLAEEFT